MLRNPRSGTGVSLYTHRPLSNLYPLLHANATHLPLSQVVPPLMAFDIVEQLKHQYMVWGQFE